jgi:uncharacterized protein YfaS (alpha-2-macroglobulin family)
MAEHQWGSVTEDLAISLSVDKPVFRAGETIPLHIALRNFGTTPSTIVVWSPWVQYPLSVRDESGRELPETPYVQQMRNKAYQMRRAMHQLEPGELVTETLDLDKAFDLKKPGLYSVSAKHPTFKKGKLDQFAELPSNELAIRIAA